MTINFELEKIKPYLENVIDSTFIDVPISVNNALIKFCDKILQYYRNKELLKYNEDNVEVYDIHKEKDDFTYVSLKNTKVTEVFFEIFKKLGLPANTIQIGLNLSNKTIYLNKGIYTYIDKLDNESFKLQIYMYIISLAYTFMHPIDVNVDSTGKINLAKSNDLLDTIYHFTENETYLIKELDLNDICSIHYYNKPSMDLNYTTIDTYIFAKTDENIPFILLIPKIGISGIIIVTESIVYTTFNLNIFMLNNSLEHILTNYTSSKNIQYISNFKTFGKSISIYDEFTDLKNKEFEKLTLDISLNLISDIKKETLSKLLKIDNITYSTTSICSDNIKELYKDDTYAQELYKNEKEYYKNFDLEDLNKIIPGFIKGDIYTMLFYGDSGTGKSTAAKVIPYKCGLPAVNINFSVNVEESDLFGTMIPNPTKKSTEDPEFIWKDGVITTAARNGYVVILEELTLARAGVLGKFNSLLDESRQIELPTGEILHAHKNFRIIATCNIGYEGTNILNAALINRFQIVKEFVELEKSEFIKVIKERTEYTDIINIETIYTVYQAIKKYSDENNLGLIISIRQMLNIFTAGKYFKTAYDAILNMLVNVAFLQDKEYKDTFIKSILPAYKLNFKI